MPTVYEMQWTKPKPGALDTVTPAGRVNTYRPHQLGEADLQFDRVLAAGDSWLRLGYRLRIVDTTAPVLRYPADDGLDAFIAEQVAEFLAELGHDRQLATVDSAL